MASKYLRLISRDRYRRKTLKIYYPVVMIAARMVAWGR